MRAEASEFVPKAGFSAAEGDPKIPIGCGFLDPFHQMAFLGMWFSNIFFSFIPNFGEDEPIFDILTSIFFFKWVGSTTNSRFHGL